MSYEQQVIIFTYSCTLIFNAYAYEYGICQKVWILNLYAQLLVDHNWIWNKTWFPKIVTVLSFEYKLNGRLTKMIGLGRTYAYLKSYKIKQDNENV